MHKCYNTKRPGYDIKLPHFLMTEGGKVKEMKSLEEMIMSDDADRLEGKTQINFEKAQNFKEACEILDSLKAKGILDYEAEDPRQPYSYHTIQVKFNFEKECDQVVDAKEISKLMAKVDKLLVSEDSISGEWQLGSRLYNMVD